MYYFINCFRHKMENSPGIKRQIEENDFIEVKKQKTEIDMETK